MRELVIRPYQDSDESTVLELLAASLGKTVDGRYRAFFRWKHLENPFGRSFMWVGEVDGRIVGFRSFLRWRFVDPGGEQIEAVRAVDTATHPDTRGTGVFRTLTMHGLDEMKPAGIHFVFNTPNDQSRPGYLKMGWRIERRIPVKVRPRSMLTLWRMARARTPAEAWSLPTTVGEPVAGLGERLDGPPPLGRDALVTERTGAFLAWRYGAFAPVASTAVCVGGGAVLMRFRRRGPAIECTVADVVGRLDARKAGSLIRSAAHGGGADYAIAAATTPAQGMVELARLGPIQTRRDVSDRPNRLPIDLTLGDVELF